MQENNCYKYQNLILLMINVTLTVLYTKSTISVVSFYFTTIPVLIMICIIFFLSVSERVDLQSAKQIQLFQLKKYVGGG